MPKILFLQNCQGQGYANFLNAGSETFARDWQMLRTIQAQSVKAEDGPWLLEQMGQADVIVAQPLQAMPVEIIRARPLVEWAKRNEKHAIFMPALQYDALSPGYAPSQWSDTFGYPFGATEDVTIAAGFVCGLTVQQAVSFFHDTATLDRDTLLKRIDHSISEYKSREADAGCSIIASEYYRQNWRRSRLHFVKGHPLPDLTRYFAAALASQLGISDFDPGRTMQFSGPDHYRMPIQRWVKDSLHLTFDDAEDQVNCAGERIPLIDMIERLYEWYGTIGADKVNRRLDRFGMFKHSKKAAQA